MKDLIERIEAAGADDHELLWEAFRAIHGPKPERVHGGSKELDDYLAKSNPFYLLLQSKAYLDAAMTLVGDDCFRVERHPMYGVYAYVGDDDAYAVTPSLALCAAALKARAHRSDCLARYGEDIFGDGK